jgi:hypothetical protein
LRAPRHRFGSGPVVDATSSPVSSDGSILDTARGAPRLPRRRLRSRSLRWQHCESRRQGRSAPPLRPCCSRCRYGIRGCIGYPRCVAALRARQSPLPRSPRRLLTDSAKSQCWWHRDCRIARSPRRHACQVYVGHRPGILGDVKVDWPGVEARWVNDGTPWPNIPADHPPALPPRRPQGPRHGAGPHPQLRRPGRALLHRRPHDDAPTIAELDEIEQRVRRAVTIHTTR